MRATRVMSPTGAEWEVRAFRVRLPPWRQVDVLGEDFASDFGLIGIAIVLLVSIVTVVVVGLLCALVEYPIAVVRSLRSDVGWVEAASYYPVDERWLWQTTRADSATVKAAVVEAVSSGRLGPVPRAQLVEST